MQLVVNLVRVQCHEYTKFFAIGIALVLIDHLLFDGVAGYGLAAAGAGMTIYSFMGSERKSAPPEART